MVDFLVALAQGLCIGGLVYGAYLSITYCEADYRKTRKRFDLYTKKETRISPTGSKSESTDRSQERRRVRA